MDHVDEFVEYEFVEYEPTTVHVICTESYATRIVTEILGAFSNAITMTFTKAGISITEHNHKQCALMDYMINEEWLQCYNFNLKDVNGYNVPSYSFKVVPSELFSAFKGTEGKRAILSFSFEICSNGSNSGIYLEINNISGKEFVKTFGFREPITESDNVYELEYAGRGTSSRLPLSSFCGMITRFKARKCNVVEFVLMANRKIYAKGRRGKDVISANYLESYINENDSGNMTAIKSDGDDETELHSIKLSLTESTWLAKLVRLAPLAVIQVYLRDKLPLVLRTQIASIGYAVFTFRDDPHMK